MYFRFFLWAAAFILSSTVTLRAFADTNVKLFTSTSDATNTTITQLGSYNDWAKTYHRVVRGPAANTAVFYSNVDEYFRVMSFSSTGSFTTLSTTSNVGPWDEVLSGKFATSGQDLLLFNREASWVRVYSIAANGTATLRFDQIIPLTSLGGYWDIVTSGFLGQSAGRDDLLLYNKAEGVAKFYRINAAGTGFDLVQSYFGWQRNWDQIIPGNINGDAYTDFLFYNQDGGSLSAPTMGHAKFISFGNNFNLTTISETFSTWPMAAHVIIVPGNFGGDSKTDFLVYNADEGTGTFWWNNGSGTYVSHPAWSWQNRWTNIAPLEVDGSGGTDLLFYTTQVALNIVPVAVNGASLTNFNQWIAPANVAYAPAGISFQYVDRGYTYTNSGFVTKTCSNNSSMVCNVNADCGAGNTCGLTCQGTISDATLNSVALGLRAQGAPNDIIVFVRPIGGEGCSGPSKEYVVMPQWNVTKTTKRYRDGTVLTNQANPKLLAHEVGHHFSLPHEMPGKPVSPAYSNRYQYDVDAAGGGWAVILDTPPNPSASSPEWTAVSNWCDDSGSNDLDIRNSSGVLLYTLNPERHTIMSKSLNCDDLYRMTPNQLEAVRENLYNARSYVR